MPIHDLLAIAYAPAAYYRPWRATYTGLQPAQQRALNAQLLRQQALPEPDELVVPAHALLRRTLRLWHQVPHVAMLMAVARLRRWVLADRASLTLPASVHAFMRMGHAEQGGNCPLPEGSCADPLVLTAWGAGCLQHAIELPAWLNARFALHFAGLPSNVAKPVPNSGIDTELLWSALRHVEAVS